MKWSLTEREHKAYYMVRVTGRAVCVCVCVCVCAVSARILYLCVIVMCVCTLRCSLTMCALVADLFAYSLTFAFHNILM